MAAPIAAKLALVLKRLDSRADLGIITYKSSVLKLARAAIRKAGGRRIVAASICGGYAIWNKK
ncbi:hypothetical protein ACERNI_08945 [Camelimonas sp. ID_303_24]